MSLLKSLLSGAGVVLGVLGIVLCIAAVVVLWMATDRVARVAERLFGGVDHSLISLRERVVHTQDRVAAAKITTADLEQALASSTRREASERLAVQLNAVENSERLATTLQQADDWLELSESAVGLAQEVVSIARSKNEPADASSLDRLLKEITALRAELAQAAQVAANIHERIAEAAEGKPLEERIEQAAQFTLRVVATLGSLDARLAKLADGITETQNQVRALEAETRWWVLAATIGVSLLVLWMAAGQAALGRLAWNGWRGTAVNPTSARR